MCLQKHQYQYYGMVSISELESTQRYTGGKGAKGTEYQLCRASKCTKSPFPVPLPGINDGPECQPDTRDAIQCCFETHICDMTFTIQGDNYTCSKPPVDFKIKVPFWPGQGRTGQAKAELLV